MPSSTSPKQPTDRRKKRKPSGASPSAQAPSAEDPNSRYAPTGWLSGGIGTLEDVTVPSGQLCLMRRPGVQGLMVAGVLHNVDSLSAIVKEKHLTAEGKIDAKSLSEDPADLEAIMHTVDRVICHCVVKPEIAMTPSDVTNRKSGVVYADMVDVGDKMFLFNYAVGGTRDLESFREGLAADVGGLELDQDLQPPAE